MENFILIVGLAKLALEVFKDERGDRYSRLKKELMDIEEEWMNEMALPDDHRSDLAIDRLLYSARQVSSKIIIESGTRE